VCVCVCVCVALVIQHALRMHHIMICVLPRSTVFFLHYLTKGAFIQKNIVEHKMCVLISSTIFVSNISKYKKK
jgi:hypothetical protein